MPGFRQMDEDLQALQGGLPEERREAAWRLLCQADEVDLQAGGGAFRSSSAPARRQLAAGFFAGLLDDDDEVRLGCIEGLGLSGDPPAMDGLIPFLNRGSSRERVEAALALARVMTRAELLPGPWPYSGTCELMFDRDAHQMDLAGERLTRVVLSRTRLDHARLRGADLTLADLDSASLVGADLQEAALIGATARRADLSFALLQGSWLLGVRLENATLQEANLQGADLRRADLRWADLTGADLREADLRGAALGAVLLDGARLEGADLGGAAVDIFLQGRLSGTRGKPSWDR